MNDVLERLRVVSLRVSFQQGKTFLYRCYAVIPIRQLDLVQFLRFGKDTIYRFVNNALLLELGHSDLNFFANVRGLWTKLGSTGFEEFENLGSLLLPDVSRSVCQ